MAKVVAIANQKGGVGKTTTCVNLSACVAALGKKVLVVDLDPQGNTTSGYGVAKHELESDIYTCLIDDEDVRAAIVKTKYNVSLLPSNTQLAGAAVELVELPRRENRLRSVLAPVVPAYDYIFIDCPPSLGLLTINALTAADSVIIPIQSEYYALEGLSQLMNTISLVRQHLNRSLKVEGVALTMYDGRSLISKQIAAEIKKYFTKKLYEIVIPRNVRLAEAPSHGKPIVLHDPKCAGARAYAALTEEFILKTEEKGE